MGPMVRSESMALVKEFACSRRPRPADFGAPNASGDAQEFKVLTYNLQWGKLLKLQKGDDGAQGDGGNITAPNASSEPYDVMGFQECYDPDWVLDSPSLVGKESILFDKGSGLCTAWSTETL